MPAFSAPNRNMAIASTAFALAITASALMGAALPRPPRVTAGGSNASAQLRADDIAALLRQRGFTEIGKPSRRGEVFLLRATGRDGLKRMIVVHPADGAIIGETVLAAPRQ